MSDISLSHTISFIHYRSLLSLVNPVDDNARTHTYLSNVDVSQPEGDEVRDVPAAHEVHDPLVGEGVRLRATVVVFRGPFGVTCHNLFYMLNYRELHDFLNPARTARQLPSLAQ